MTIRVALHHRTTYEYDRQINLGPHIVRLRPAPHCRTPINSYSLKIQPPDHFCNWQQDPQGNYLARLVFPEPARRLQIEVDVIAEMTVINPFDFFLEPSADEVPFKYEKWLAKELAPYLEKVEPGPLLQAWLDSVDLTPLRTVDFLVGLNQRLQHEIDYLIRMEPGVQAPEETLTLKRGSCRDSAWLMVQILRHLGMAARFCSGYLIQLVPDVKPLDGPAGPPQDFTDLHAWCEVYLPGAGWVGLDPTSGLFAGEGHIPLACTPDPVSAAPVTGFADPAECEFSFHMEVTRIHEDPRVTKPYSDQQWDQITAMGHLVDERLNEGDVRLTMGGEPTFVSIDDMEGEEWTTAAVGPDKWRKSLALARKMRDRYAPGGLLHAGQGKWYPGESLPRWALACFWRKDGEPIWHNPELMAVWQEGGKIGTELAEQFMFELADTINVDQRWIRPAYEDVFHYMWKEQRLPMNVDPWDPKLDDPEERHRMMKVFERGLSEVAGFVMPLKRQWWQAKPRWKSGPWPIRPEKMFLLPGDSPVGLRLPLDMLPWVPVTIRNDLYPQDPWDERRPLPRPRRRDGQRFVRGEDEAAHLAGISQQRLAHRSERTDEREVDEHEIQPGEVIRTALCIEPRDGKLYVFMPPTELLEDYLDLVASIEETAERLGTPVVIEGYLPPIDDRLQNFKITPDPGVLEINIQPSSSWDDLVGITTGLYDDARETRLGTEKFDLDGKHTGTGGGNHVVMGGARPSDSPFLRRPDVLKSLVGYWNNHPSLSYMLSGRFIGPTSQAPRVDESRHDAIYEMQVAFAQVPKPGGYCPPWLVDRIFRNLLVDLTGNTHRAEFCIDKLFSPDSATGRLGLLEFRGFEMPPHARMSLTQQLLLRAMVVRFWEDPYEETLVDWGTALHDRFMLSYYVQKDFEEVLGDLCRHKLPMQQEWFAPHFEFRFQLIGEAHFGDLQLELRQAIEPWYVLGEEPGASGTVRYVDSSVERIQVKMNGVYNDRYILTCNGRRVPLTPTGQVGECVAGVRFRAWQPPSCLHPTIPVHSPLVFDILDTWQGRSLGGCTYHVTHPGGRSYDTFPVNGNEAESRRAARFFKMGHTAGHMTVPRHETNLQYPLTLDLRRSPQPW